MPREYPKDMYHKTLTPIRVYSRKEEEKLGPEWQTTYFHQDYPKTIYHKTERAKLVRSKAEEEKYRPIETPDSLGWAEKPFPEKQKPEPYGRQGVGVAPGTIEVETYQKVQMLDFDLDIVKRDMDRLKDTIDDLQKRSELFQQALIAVGALETSTT